MEVRSHSGEIIDLPYAFHGNIQDIYSTSFLLSLRTLLTELIDDVPISGSKRTIAKVFEMAVKNRWITLVGALSVYIENMEDDI